ncbi:MAG: hypothetical protein RL637_1268 [Pseudomonadota bacterium]|jgi:ferredoxin-NADP reductase/ferredoxin
MSFHIKLITRDQKLIEFDCNPEQTVQDAAEAASFFLPTSCKSGSCGICFGYCTSGNYHQDSASEGIFSADAELKHEILLCRLYADSDLAIKVPYPSSQIRRSIVEPRSAEIVEVKKVAERTFQLILQLLPDYEHGIDFEFEPGQFVELEIPKFNIKRAYSIANEPNWEGRLEFFIRLQLNGQFSHYLLQQAKVGDYVQIHGPMGHFTLPTQGLKPTCFIAGGTGIAPFLSMLRRLSAWGEDYPIQLFFGINTEAEYFAQTELKELSLPQLKITPCVWQASENWQGFIGTPVEAFKRYLQQTSVLPQVLLCGPPALVEAAIEVAIQAGISTEHIWVEKF